jgi:hypothetical protein
MGLETFRNFEKNYMGEKVLELPETCKSTKIFFLAIVEKNVEIFLWPPLLQSKVQPNLPSKLALSFKPTFQLRSRSRSDPFKT